SSQQDRSDLQVRIEGRCSPCLFDRRPDRHCGDRNTWARRPCYSNGPFSMQTVVHVTHEAIQKIGGIGAVLQGLLTSKVYLEQAPRNILVGPFWPGDERGEQRLGPQGEVLYSSLDHLYRSPLAPRFREIEQAYDVGIVYGG